MTELAEIQRRTCAHLARIGGRRGPDDELIAKARLAVSQSFQVLSRVPDLSVVGELARPLTIEIDKPGIGEEVDRSHPSWTGLSFASDLRFFFDIDDGKGLHIDEIGIVLNSEEDVPRETKSMLFDLAQAAVPECLPRLFTARVRDRHGVCVYEGSVKLKPLPPERL